MNDVIDVWSRSGENLEAIACIFFEILSLEAWRVGKFTRRGIAGTKKVGGQTPRKYKTLFLVLHIRGIADNKKLLAKSVGAMPPLLKKWEGGQLPPLPPLFLPL